MAITLSKINEAPLGLENKPSVVNNFRRFKIYICAQKKLNIERQHNRLNRSIALSVNNSIACLSEKAGSQYFFLFLAMVENKHLHQCFLMKIFKNIALSILVIGLVFFAIEFIVAKVLFKEDSYYYHIRKFVLIPNATSEFTPQVFLNYITTPGHKNFEGKLQINTAGLRSRNEYAIPKKDSTLRILFLGGSTTYGEVDDLEMAFPYIIETQLKEQLAALKLPFNTIECLNAGLGSGTSAELLNHYQLKYQYFNPDLVVIHTGINDGLAYANTPDYTYQPDYHTFKKTMQPLPAITPFIRNVSKSYIGSALLANTLFKAQLQNNFTNNDFLHYHNNLKWFSGGNDSMLIPQYNAFYNNISSLINTILFQQKKVLLVTEVVNEKYMPQFLKDMLGNGVAINNNFLLQIAKQQNIPLCNLSNYPFHDTLFIADDGIHVNETGEVVKAKAILKHLLPIINPTPASKK